MFFDLFFITLGLVFGSFFSALSYRLPKGISIARGRSFCPHCKHQINWYDNLPLISFIFLGGRCRYCKKQISFRYPTIEFITALGFLVIFRLGGTPLHLLFSLLIFSILILIFVIDFEHQIIPDSLAFLAILLTFIKLVFVDNQSIFEGFFAGFLAGLMLLTVHFLTKGRGMGLGDVKFAVFGGIFVGLHYLPIWLFLSFAVGGVFGLALIGMRQANLKDKIAFGPFLLIGLAATYLWGPNIYRYLFP